MPSPTWPIHYYKSPEGVALKFRCWKFQVIDFRAVTQVAGSSESVIGLRLLRLQDLQALAGQSTVKLNAE